MGVRILYTFLRNYDLASALGAVSQKDVQAEFLMVS